MINALIHYELIHSTAEGHYMLSRDLNHITLYDLAQILPYRLPVHVEIEYAHSSLAERWNRTFKQNDTELQKTFNIDLERLFREQSKK